MNKYHKQISNSKIETERKLKKRNQPPRNFLNLTNRYRVVFSNMSACYATLPKSKDLVNPCWTNNDKQELLSIDEHMGSNPVFFSVGLVLLIILNFWVLLFVCLGSVFFTLCCLWIVHSWLSLQCSFWHLFNTTANCTFKPLDSRHFSSLS